MNEATEPDSNEPNEFECPSNSNNEVNNEIISTLNDSYTSKSNPNAGISVNMPSMLSSFTVLNFNSNDSSDLIMSHCINLQVFKYTN